MQRYGVISSSFEPSVVVWACNIREAIEKTEDCVSGELEILSELLLDREQEPELSLETGVRCWSKFNVAASYCSIEPGRDNEVTRLSNLSKLSNNEGNSFCHSLDKK